MHSESRAVDVGRRREREDHLPTVPKAEGLWAGIVIPEAGRGRGHALRQLRELAERNGYSVRARRVFLEPVLESA